MPTALVTGANRGLGLAFAAACLARGFDVVACARNPDADSLLDLASGAAGRLDRVPLDLGDFASIEALAARLAGRPIDVLVNNAALTGGPVGEFGRTDYARWAEAFRLNAMAPMRMMERLADNVAASGRKVIFNVSSRIGPRTSYGYVEYRSSKSALNAVVQQVSMALAPRGIIVVAAHPGWVGTEATAAMGAAPLTPAESAAMLMKIIDGLTLEDTGRFFEPDGTTLPIVTHQREPKFYSLPRT